MGRIRVTFTGEGTYPYVTGGVSTWADILINKMKDFDFILIPIMMTPYLKIKYQLPANVIQMIKIPLWGSEEPSEFVHLEKFSRIYLRKLKTIREMDAIDQMIELLDNILEFIYLGRSDFDELGKLIVKFYDFFQEYDYHEAFRSKIVWDSYLNKMKKIFKDRNEKEIPSIYDMIESLRFLYRFFIVLLAPVPKTEIYHSSAAAFCGLPCIIGKLKHGGKFILTEHGIYTREQYLFSSREGIRYRTKEFLMGLIGTIVKLNYYFADVIAPVCNYNQRWELKWGADPKKIKTIYNGVDVLRFRKFSVQRSDRPTVIMVARIDPLKDIETFILTCNEVRKAIPDVLFKLYGPQVEKEYYDKCKSLVNQLNLEKNFEFAGPTDRPEVAYNEGDVVALTSISEAFPFTVIEAMACEKVVVSSDVGGTKEVLEGFGFVVKPRDYIAFSKAIVKVLKNKKEAERMGIEARERVLMGFTIDDMVENYSNLYFSVVGSLYEKAG